MQCREIRPRLGDHVTLINSHNSYSLPSGLQPGTKAKLLSHSYGTMRIEYNGVTWDISDRCIEYQFEYEVQRRWYPSTHPIVLQQKAAEDALRKMLGERKKKDTADEHEEGRR